MSYSKSELKALQNRLFELLEKTTNIFEENNISFVACGGTALGIERHSNIIPWDDDIDLAVFIDDYNQLIRLKDIFKIHNLEILEFRSNPKSPYIFLKIIDLNTTFIEKNARHLDIPKGVFIDVFPFDYLPKNNYSYFTRRVIYQLLQQSFIVKETTYHPKRLKQLLKFILKILTIWVPKTLIFDLMSKLYCNRGKEIGFLGFKNLKFRKEQYDEAIKKPFGNLMIPQIKDSKEHLQKYYGKGFMSLPPLEKRLNHEPLEMKL